MKKSHTDLSHTNANRYLSRRRWALVDTFHISEHDYLVDSLNFLMDMRKDRVHTSTSRAKQDRLEKRLQELMKTLKPHDSK